MISAYSQDAEVVVTSKTTPLTYPTRMQNMYTEFVPEPSVHDTSGFPHTHTFTHTHELSATFVIFSAKPHNFNCRLSTVGAQHTHTHSHSNAQAHGWFRVTHAAVVHIHNLLLIHISCSSVTFVIFEILIRKCIQNIYQIYPYYLDNMTYTLYIFIDKQQPPPQKHPRPPTPTQITSHRLLAERIKNFLCWLCCRTTRIEAVEGIHGRHVECNGALTQMQRNRSKQQNGYSDTVKHTQELLILKMTAHGLHRSSTGTATRPRQARHWARTTTTAGHRGWLAFCLVVWQINNIFLKTNIIEGS